MSSKPSDFHDCFSTQAAAYARFRPHYPDELYDFLNSLCEVRDLAWDCATGNGQAAVALSKFFKQVVATDASTEQIRHALPCPGVTFKVATAEQSGLSDASVDLITVATAAHWFDQQRFFSEAARVLKPKGVLAIWSYGFMAIAPGVDAVLKEFHEQVLAKHWPMGILADLPKFYRGLQLPWPRLKTPEFKLEIHRDIEWWFEHIRTWSATQAAIRATGSDPLSPAWEQRFRDAWGPVKVRTISWPLSLAIALKSK